MIGDKFNGLTEADRTQVLEVGGKTVLYMPRNWSQTQPQLKLVGLPLELPTVIVKIAQKPQRNCSITTGRPLGSPLKYYWVLRCLGFPSKKHLQAFKVPMRLPATKTDLF